MQAGFPKFILNADGSRLTSEQLTSIAQAWLFFGLLTEVFSISGISIDPEDFVEREAATIYVTTREMSHYLERLEQAELMLPVKIRKEHFRRQQKTIILAMVFRLHQISDHWFQDTDSWRAFYEPPAERYKMAVPLPIEVSLSILEDTLDRASQRSFGKDHDSVDKDFLCKGLIKSLQKNGWCPSETSLILQSFENTSAFFASRLERLRTKADHSKCTTNKCFAFHINTDEYETQHTKDCRGCTNVSIDYDELAEILHLNKTPRARVEVMDEEPHIVLTLADSGPYVAISHVWSDGLGNAEENVLPSCQLLRLRNLTNDLEIEFAQAVPSFWIDSLLVPARKGIEKRLVLNRLSQYYTDGTKVLVLDSDLFQASTSGSQEEQMTRVFFCTWMRRLWTLEEVILSHSRLEFQLCDGTLSMEHLLQTNTTSLALIMLATICITLCDGTYRRLKPEPD